MSKDPKKPAPKPPKPSQTHTLAAPRCDAPAKEDGR